MRNRTTSRSPWLSTLAALAIGLTLPIAAAEHTEECDQAPPTTYRAGRVDDFAGETDPSSRSAALEAAYPQAVWKEFDDMTSNRFVGHSFLNLPENISRAELEIRMKPHADIPNNDSLTLGLDGSGSVVYGVGISTLPEAGGTWNATDNGATTFQLDLGALPGGGEVLSLLMADRALDLRVQDDTAVDYVKLRIWTCPARLSYSGLPHRPLGTAELSLDDDGELTVSGLDGSGESGVATDVGEAEGLWTVMPVDFSTWDDGAYIESRNLGVIDGEPGAPAGSMRLLREGDLLAFLPDFGPLGTVDSEVLIRDEGRLVFRSSSGLGWGLLLDVLDGIDIDIDIRFSCRNVDIEGGTETSWGIDIDIEVDNEPETRFLGPDGTLVSGDEIVINSVGSTATPTAFTGFEMVSAWLPGLEIESRGVFYDGLEQNALGGATFEPTVTGLSLANLGESGDDGVAVDLDRSESADLGFDPIDPFGLAAAGAFLEVTASGSQDGIPGQTLGQLTITQLEAPDYPFEVTADFDDIGSSTHRIELYRQGEMLLEIPDHVGPVARVASWPRGLGKLGGELECYVGHYPLDTDFLIDGFLFQADELRVLAENDDGAVDFKSELAVRAAGLDELTLNAAEVVEAPPCVANSRRLCLNDGRFAVEADWETPQGQIGTGKAVPMTDETGYFWFFNPDNVEVVIKALDGCGVNDRFWVFAAGLTNVEVELTVTDTVTGDVKTYTNPLGQAFSPILDTRAFDSCSAAGRDPSDPSASDDLARAAFADLKQTLETDADREIAPKATTLALNDGRFLVAARWETPAGNSGDGQAVALTDETGYFWFFSSDNVEVVIKALDGCGINDRFWVFAAGLTNVEVELTVTDTVSGQVKTYVNPLGMAFEPIQDTTAFATCP